MTFIQKISCRVIALPVLCLLISCKTNKVITVINSKDAPAAIGPYSQAIKTGDFIFCSGQIGLSPSTGQLVGSDISSQTIQALQNLKIILEEAGSDFSHVTKVTIFLTDMNNYSKVNEIYSTYFTNIKPARSVVQVVALPKGALVEIECVAVTK